jgi:copper chaperone NosL
LLGLTGMAGLLAACSRQEEAAPAPSDIVAGLSCDLDGMLLADYPGPKAQLRYQDQATPVFFCDTLELLATLLRPEQVRPVQAAWVQDMGQADWAQPQGHWIDAHSALYVLGSKRHGSMGPTAASFAREEDARAFIAQHGGRLLRLAEITPDMVDLGGGAKADQRM